MKSAVLITFGLVLASMLIASEAAAQGCKEGCAPCVVGRKKGTRCCENGKLSACIPDLDQEGGPRFAAARSAGLAKSVRIAIVCPVASRGLRIVTGLAGT